MDGVGAEVVKNLVLSGVKSVRMWDDKVAVEKDFESQFLIPEDSLNENVGIFMHMLTIYDS